MMKRIWENFGAVALSMVLVFTLYMLYTNTLNADTATVNTASEEVGATDSDREGLELLSEEKSTTQQYRDEIEVKESRKEELVTHAYSSAAMRERAEQKRKEERDRIAALDVPESFTTRERQVCDYIWSQIRWEASCGRNNVEIKFDYYDYEWTYSLRNFILELGYTIENRATPGRYLISW